MADGRRQARRERPVLVLTCEGESVYVLILGAAGMIGRKLTARLVADQNVGGHAIERLTLVDVVAPQQPASAADQVELVAKDLAAPGEAERLVEGRPDLIFHLAAVVSGEAEADFEKGYRVNLEGTRALLEAVRAAHTADGYHPRMVFPSSIAVYGSPLPNPIPEDFQETPLTSYGTQKAIGELLLADYTRRGFVDGIGIRLPTICIRPGPPNKAASGFFSSILREPLVGQEAVLPVPETVPALARLAPLSRGVPGPGGDARRSAGRSATDAVHARPQRHRGRADRGAAPGRRRSGCPADPPRAGRVDHAHRRDLGPGPGGNAGSALGLRRRQLFR
jgi:NAD(P)-dependent dehydrogenase (short-subunit alcohol dehydrogenase family)